MRVAAIDAAPELSGWAVCERVGGTREAVVAHGCFRVRNHGEVTTAIDGLAEFAPDVVAIESPYVGVNADTALVLAETVGRLRQEIDRRGFETITTKATIWQMGILRGLVTTYSPRAARKAASVLWARRSLGIEVDDDNVADALALAVWTLRTRMMPTTLPLALAEPHAGRRRRPRAA